MLLNQEISMSDGAVPPDAPDLGALHDVSRRQALLTLGALPLAMTGARPSPGASQAMTDDMFLARCAASLTACWHLLKGSDLGAVEQLLASYLVPLEAIAYQDSPRREAAAVLAAQAHRVCGIIALHRDQLRVREDHCRRALHFAEVASDADSHASALISLASTYFYAADPGAAAAVYEQTFRHGGALPPLQQARVHAELAVVYGQLGREQDALRAAGRAEELYPDRPESDPSYLYAEFTPASLTLEQGLAYVALAEQFPGRGYQDRAAEIFSHAAGAGPARIRFEIINHQAGVAVLVGDLDAFDQHMTRGMAGVALLSSRQRLREMHLTWQKAAARWPGERRLQAISDGLRQTAAAGTELDVLP
jgi:tetratricopeptide (TPR) repeat protein